MNGHTPPSPKCWRRRRTWFSPAPARTVASLQQATRTVPIVFTMIYEPVAQGFVASLAHPGGNTTGFTMVEAMIGAKWLELLKEIRRISRVLRSCSTRTTPVRCKHSVSVEAAAPNNAVQAVRTHGKKRSKPPWPS